MQTLPEALGRRPGIDEYVGAREPQPQPRSVPVSSLPTAWPRNLPRLGPTLAALRWPLAVYAASRILYLLVALADTLLHGWPLGAELSNWDGLWYLALTGQGYPTHVSHLQTTLGFFPLYPMALWVLSHVLMCSYVVAGVVVSMIGGFAATVIVQRLVAGWWGEEASRRAVLFFCLFPGSIVFSMVYSEGLLLPLAAGCILALERRRWLLAGVLAAAATAVGPVALAIIPACVAAAVIEIRRKGWHDRRARRAILAPLLAPVGIAAFGVFLWIWTGSPFASYTAQRYGWGEHTHALALVQVAQTLVHQIAQFHDIHHPGINLNYVSGLVGALFLLVALALLFRRGMRVSVEAILWTVGIAFLTLTSANAPPNPRMLIAAFPAVLVVAYRLRDKAFSWLVATSTLLLVAMSVVSFVGRGLRP